MRSSVTCSSINIATRRAAHADRSTLVDVERRNNWPATKRTRERWRPESRRRSVREEFGGRKLKAA